MKTTIDQFTPCRRPSQLSIQARMCNMKMAYDTREDALGPTVRVYRCPFCRKWHKTHLKKTRPRS